MSLSLTTTKANQMSTLNRIFPKIKPEPELRLVKSFHDAETGITWRVVTEWWPAGSPEAEGGDPDPLNPELVVIQRCVRSENDLLDRATFYPVLGLSAD